MERHNWTVELVLSTQVAPVSLDVQMFPPILAAAMLVPVEDIVIVSQKLGSGLAAAVTERLAHAAPELVDTHICPPESAAANTVPSADDATAAQKALAGGPDAIVQVAPASADVQTAPVAGAPGSRKVSNALATPTSFWPSAEEAKNHQFSGVVVPCCGSQISVVPVTGASVRVLTVWPAFCAIR